jgi:hypothetical protein
VKSQSFALITCDNMALISCDSTAAEMGPKKMAHLLPL